MEDILPKYKCCLCGGDIETQANGWTGGHNPEPLAPATSRCCGTCNSTKVIPERLYQVTR